MEEGLIIEVSFKDCFLKFELMQHIFSLRSELHHVFSRETANTLLMMVLVIFHSMLNSPFKLDF